MKSYAYTITYEYEYATDNDDYFTYEQGTMAAASLPEAINLVIEKYAKNGVMFTSFSIMEVSS